MPPIPCPSCGAALPAAPVACPACHLPLTGPEAVRLWQLDQQLSSLQTERVALIQALRARDTATGPEPTGLRPTPGALATTAPAATGAGGAEGLPVPLGAPRRRWTTQQTLLAVGVLLVLVAASIALAFAWFVIGPYGQMVVMGGLTALAVYTSLYVSRRGLPSSAEALALVASGLLLLDVAAARRFGLFGLDHVGARGYTVATGLLVAAALAALHRTDRRIAAYALTSLTAASVAWAAVVSFAHGPASAASLALLGALAFGAARVTLPASLGLTRRAAAGPASLWSAVALTTAFVGAARAAAPEPLGDRLTGPSPSGLGCVAVLVALSVGATLLVRRVVAVRAGRLGSRAAVRADWSARLVSGDWRALSLVALVGTAAGPAAVLGLGLQVGGVGTALLSVLVAAVGTALLALRPARQSLGDLWILAQVGVAELVLVALAIEHHSDGATVVTLVATAALAAAAAVLRPRWLAPAAGVSALALLFAVAVAGGMRSPETQVLAVTAYAGLLSAFALARRGRPDEQTTGVVALLSFVLALAAAAPLAEGYAAATLAAGAVAAAATAVLRPRVRPAAAGVSGVSGTGALWLVGGLASPDVQWLLLALSAALLATLALWLRGRAEEVVLGTLAGVAAVATVAVALDRGWPHAASGSAAAYGLLAVVYAALPQRRALVTVAVAGLTTATWVELLEADVSRLEAYTLPCALLLLAAGLWSHRELGDRSWTVAGPALLVALVPSATATAFTDDLARALLTVTVATAVLVVGAWRRWQALVVVGAAAAALVAVTQLGPYTLHAPRFLTLGTLGVLLLLVGARYEQRRDNARQALSWLASLS
jgi:hypothetical protein